MVFIRVSIYWTGGCQKTLTAPRATSVMSGRGAKLSLIPTGGAAG